MTIGINAYKFVGGSREHSSLDTQSLADGKEKRIEENIKR